MSKIFIAANTMMIGGIETSLISFLNTIDYSRHTVTLLLQEKSGELLNKIPSKVEVIEYKPFNDKNIIVRKIKNRLRFIKFIRDNKNKYDVSICYASYIYLPSIFVRKICKNNYMWVHCDYTKIYNNKEFIKFRNKYGYMKFKNLVFVSKDSLNNYSFKNKKQNYLLCRNLLPYEKIIKQSNEEIEFDSQNTTFLNVSRHAECSKKISRIIEATTMLLEEKINDFTILLVGNGRDTDSYKKQVIENKLDKQVKFIEATTNPFPYYKKADCFLMTSDYEGGPITVFESLILGLPVITTDVGDVKEYVNEFNGIIIKKNSAELKEAMKEIILNKKKFDVKFDYKEFNQECLDTINKIIEVRNNDEI